MFAVFSRVHCELGGVRRFDQHGFAMENNALLLLILKAGD